MIATNRRPLSKSEQTLVAMLGSLISEKGYSPSVKELAAALGIACSRCYAVLKSSEWKGYVTSAPHSSRSWRVVAPAVAAEPEVSLAKTRTRRKAATSTGGTNV